MKKHITLCSYYLMLVTLLLSAVRSAAQVNASAYSYAASSGTYSYLSGGTAITAIQADEALSGAIPIGFTFNYCGTNYTSLLASSNGWLSFNTALTSSLAGNSVTNLNSAKPAIFPLWDDNDGSAVYGGSATYLTSGTAPNRTFTIEYKNWHWNYSATSGVISFQAILYEGSNVIRYIYKPESGSITGTPTASIGIGDAGGTPTYLSLNNATATATASSSSFTTNIATKPASGQIYQFTPPVCTTPAPGASVASATSICLGAPVTLSLSSPTPGMVVSYQWQSSPDNVLYTDMPGATTASYTSTPTAVLYYKCNVTCSSGPATTASAPVLVSFPHAVLTTAPAVRCGLGTVSLSATTSTGTTAKWYTSVIGGSPVGSGSPFVTPTIAATTNYYVGAEVSSVSPVSIGSGTATLSSTGQTPFSMLYTSAHSQYLILASDLSATGLAAGGLSSLSFNVTTKSSTKAYSGYTIKIAHTTATSLSGLLSPAFTTIYGPSSYSSVAGANTFSFASAFSWDGSSNLLVDVCFDNVTPATGYTSNDAVSATTKSYTATYGLYADPTNLCGAATGGSSTSATALPNMTITGNKVCSSPRSLVTATVNTPPGFSISNDHTICNNTIDTLSVLTGTTSFNTYTWSPATNLFTDAAATIPYTAGTSATRVYYKSATAGSTNYIATANNSTTLCAAADTVIITNMPATAAALATPASICVSGDTRLTVIPATGYGNGTYQWQSSADNSIFADSAGANTSSLTTRTLSSTRFYRVLIKNSTGATCITSVSDTAKVNNPAVLTTIPAVRCGSGTVVLGATGASGTLKWYSTASGGTSVGFGTSFTTPVLLSSTPFYVETEATAPAPFTIGAGGAVLGSSTSENGLTPFSQYYEGQHTQHLILAADLVASGLIKGNLVSLSFNISEKNSSKAYTDYTVKVAMTTSTSLSSLLAPAFTTVYGPSSYTSALGANKFSFLNPFYWDGTSNVLVDVCFANDPSGAGTLYTNNDVVSATTKTYTGTYGYYQDNSALCGVTSPASASSDYSTKVPVIVFEQAGCMSPRTAVIATVNTIPTPTITPAGPVNICSGYTTTLTGGGGGTYQWRNESGPIAGATAATYTASVSGKYKVVVTTPATGCNDSSVAVTVNVNPSPTVSIAPAGNTKICADSMLRLTSIHTGTDITYQWYLDSAAIPGAVTDSFSANVSGSYTLKVNLGTCGNTSNVVTLKVNPLPAASFNIASTNTAICPGGTIELIANAIPAGYTYQWRLDGSPIPGAGSRVYLAGREGTYTVQVRDTNNCRIISEPQDIFNTLMPKPSITPKDLRFCAGNSVILYSNAGPYARKFIWEKNSAVLPEHTPEIITASAGTYQVTVTDSFNCTIVSDKITVEVYDLPVKPVITKTGYLLSTGTYPSYQWYRNGKPISGATKPIYTMLYDGKYHVVVGTENSCYASSDTINVERLDAGTVSLGQEDIRIYPNPSSGIVYIETPTAVDLQVKDVQGRQVMFVKDATSADLTQLAAGIYIFNLTDASGRLIHVSRVVRSAD